MKKHIIFLFLIFQVYSGSCQDEQELLDFEFEGIQLSGVLNFPKQETPKGIVLIIHGDGKTDAVAGQWWYDVRMSITKAGYATYMWDKMGCGKSGGVYKNGRPIQEEALEVIAAIRNLKQQQIKGANKIGLWGISRAGWINPVVMSKYKQIDFWISVSGVEAHETFKYLLEQNLRISGLPKDSVDLLVNEWHNGILLSRGGASYEYYLLATQNLQKHPFWIRITNGGISEVGYYEYQKILYKTTLDKKSDLPLYVENFDQILSKIDVPVLALFGETDMTVNWKAAKELYEKTLKPNIDLTIQSFPNCNHNMRQSKTGGIYEHENNHTFLRCDGFLDSITNWLNQLKLN